VTAATPSDAQLNPFKRKRDKPVTYWSGIVDVNGHKDFQLSRAGLFPRWPQVMAVAVAPDRIGVAESSTVVRGDFVADTHRAHHLGARRRSRYRAVGFPTLDGKPAPQSCAGGW